MDYEVQPWPFPHRGLQTEYAERHVPPDALVTCEDMYYPAPHVLRGRGRLTSLGALAAGAVRLMYYWDYDANLYWASGSNLYYDTGSGTGITGPAEIIRDMVAFGVTVPYAFDTGLTSAEKSRSRSVSRTKSVSRSISRSRTGEEWRWNSPSLIVAEDLEDQGHTLHSWDGVHYDAIDGTNVPNVRLLMVRHGRLFGARDPDAPSRIYFSDVGDPTIWSGAFAEGGYIDVAPGYDGEIVDWIDYNGVLYVFKERGVYQLIGDLPSTYAVRKFALVHDPLRGTLRDCARGIMYATTRGVFVLGQRAWDEPAEISQPIAHRVQDLFGDSGLTFASAEYAPELSSYLIGGYSNGAAHEQRVYLSNLANRPDVWTEFLPGFLPSCIYQGDSLYVASSTGTIYRYEHGFVGGTAHLQTGYWDMGDLNRMKNIRYLQGPFNARDNIDCTITFHSQEAGSTQARSYSVIQGARALVSPNLNCEAVSVELEYG